tara:strand:+ start:7667 stop:8737 length:1071 start_codon:yes stop_codon:yes gene_type:complete
MKDIQVDKKKIGLNHPTYFIADIAANHNGDLNRAIDLIYLSAEAGADAVKFQHFQAENIVSDYGFKNLDTKSSHQSNWKKSVFDTYKQASLPREWTEELQNSSNKAGVHFFSAPYDFEAVDLLDNLNVPAHKVGSGDITWIEIIQRMCKRKVPIFLATGASNIEDVKRAMKIIQSEEVPVCLMQCNTNYTGKNENFEYINLNVLKQYSQIWPDAVLGLSDHTSGHATVLGAVALGARAIEKHFTNDKSQEGPDHGFSMDPLDWKDMVDRTRELELALGEEEKKICENEIETVVLQRRCWRLKNNLSSGTEIKENHLEVLRPSPLDSINPYEKKDILGKKINKNMVKGQHISIKDFE